MNIFTHIGAQVSENTNKDNTWIKSTCAYCGVGCGIEARPSAPGKLEIRGDKEHPANFGRLCSKGLALGDTVSEEGRLSTPSIAGKTVNWPQAIDHVADNFKKTIEKYGPDSVAFYVSGQLLTEDYYVANKLIKGYIGTANIDTNSRLCMSSSVAGHKRAFGSDTVPNCYEDFELAELIVLVGSNLAWCHPVLYQRIKAAKAQNPALKIVVIDPRKTDSCELADLHLAIKSGADVALFNGLLVYLAENHCLNHSYLDRFTEGFAQAIDAAQQDSGDEQLDWQKLSQTTGIPLAYLETFYQWFAETDKTLSIYSQGVNQSSAGTDKVNSIINCHLATGRIGREGCGPFSITGQPNAMGGREVGGLANMLAAHMDFDNPEHLQTVKDFWQSDKLASKPGLKAVDLFDAVDQGKIQALWIMATNPVVSMPDADKIKRALEKCPLVVVSDCIADTDTTRCADVLLPAMGWSEKSGTVTNSERRISRQRQLLATTGEAKPDWWIICQVALRMGYAGFNFTCAADVFREYARMTGADNEGKRDLDISPLASLSNQDYDQLQPRQWPVSAVTQNFEAKRFFAQGNFFTPNKKGRLIAVNHRPPKTKLSPAYPLVLNSGRIRDQWHTMTRTGLAAQLTGHIPEPYIQINPEDAHCFQLSEGDIAQVDSAWGSAKARVTISNDVKPGQIFMPMHWTQVDSSEGRICTLISPDVDPISGQPEAKFTPVAIKPWAFLHEAMVVTKNPIDTSAIDYWIKRRIAGGFCYYMASQQEQTKLYAQLAERLPKLEDSHRIAFDNSASGHHRGAAMQSGDLQFAYIVADRVNRSDYAWLDSLLARTLDTEIQRSILSGKAADSLITGRQVCACKQVGELTLINAIKAGCTSIEAIGQETQAGTGCGSCIPEISQLIASESTGSGEELVVK